MNQQEIHSTSEVKRVKDLTAIMYLLQSNLEGIINEAEGGYQRLTRKGEKTALVQSEENNINNSISKLSDMSVKLDGQIKNIIDKYVSSFFNKNGILIETAIRSKSTLNNLHYSIVLKEDNMQNRLAIFDFLSDYDAFDMDISSRYPVYFQFIPRELVEKINVIEEVVYPKA